jgi:Ser/Thr protein kinase RdoA (MazF antagonist)
MRHAQAKQPREAVPFARAMERFLAASGLSERVRDWPVFRAWSEALGEALGEFSGRHARAVRFARGELFVEVDSAAHLHELANFTGEQVRALANSRLGSEQIRRVHFQLKR